MNRGKTPHVQDKSLGSWIREHRGEPTPPLILACRSGASPEAVQAHLDAGAAVEARDALGWTPLHCAARHARLDLMRVLTEAGSDLRAVNQRKSRPFQAIRAKSAEDQAEYARWMREQIGEDLLVPLHKEFVPSASSVPSESFVEEVHDSITFGLSEGILEEGLLRLRARVTCSSPPLNLAFDAYWLAGGTRYAAGTWCTKAKQSTSEVMEGFVPLGAGVIRLLLVPRESLGRECYGSTRVFGEELLLPPYSIAMVDEFSDWNQR